MKADYQAALRDTAAKQQQVNADQATYDRYAALVKQRAVTQQETDDARYKLAADQQAVRASESQARAQLAKLSGNPDIAVEDTPAFKQAQARLAEAEREMNHSVVRAPYDGIVTQVNKLQLGMYLGASTAAFGLVSTDHVWVEAEPKETQLTYAKRGRPGRCQLRPLSRTAPGTARWRASRRQPTRISRCCRRRIRPATGSRWCSGFRFACGSTSSPAIRRCARA